MAETKALTTSPGDWRSGAVVGEVTIVETTPPPRADLRALYEHDEFGWLQQHVALLRAGRLDEIDHVSLAEFLSDMARRDERELRSRLIVLIMHMLKAEHQPEKLSDGWVGTIEREQDEIGQILKSATLARLAPSLLAEAWPVAVRRAARETGLPAETFPKENPWTVEQVLAYVPPPVPPHPSEPEHAKKPRRP